MALLRIIAALGTLTLLGCAASGPLAQIEEPQLRAEDYGPNISEPMLSLLVELRTGDPLLEPKIMDGEPARQGDDPWQTALIFGRTPDAMRMAFCGGSVVAPNWVLTAAHCVDGGTPPDAIDILTGSVEIADAQRHRVAEILIHPDWVKGPPDGRVFRNDIALIRLAQPTTAAAVGLPASPNGPGERASTTVRVTGWGRTTEDAAAMETRLRTVDVSVVSDSDCRDRASYGDRDPTTPPLIDTMLCAGFTQGGRDSCQGDSGGPLTAAARQGRELVGIVSWGKGCGRRGKYGVYTRVSRYSDWVSSCIAGRACPRQ